MKTLNFLWVFLAALMMQSCQGQSPCTYQGGNLDYLSKITCADDYNILAGKPLTEKYGQVKSIKLIFRLKNKHLYFAESKKYPLHFRFCQEVLNDNQSLYGFNKGNYYNSINRQYILANLNYYSALNIYCLEFFNGDEVTAPQIKMLFDSLVSKAPILASRLKLLINTPEIESRHLSISSIPFINVNTIYEHQTYQTLTKGIAYGYLRVIDKKAFKKFVFNKHDIIITNTIPNTLPVVAGVITVPFQTPLCHISVLCANRKTPNAAYRLAFTDKQILKLENKLVRFEVFADSFTITDATAELKKIELVWKKEENKKKIKLAFDLKTSGILEVSQIIYSDSKTVGGKAANFGELDKIRLANKKVIPLPESAFAIPFYWYHQHLI